MLHLKVSARWCPSKADSQMYRARIYVFNAAQLVKIACSVLQVSCSILGHRFIAWSYLSSATYDVLQGRTPLHLAALGHAPDVAQLLLSFVTW